MQYAITLLPSRDHFGGPQKSPCWESRFNPLPSGRTRYISTRWRCSQRPFAIGSELSRSEEKAIHIPSGDHAGRKSPPGPDVSDLALRVLTSRVQRSAVPPRASSRRRSGCHPVRMRLIVIGRVVRQAFHSGAVRPHTIEVRGPFALGSEYDPLPVGGPGRIVVECPLRQGTFTAPIGIRGVKSGLRWPDSRQENPIGGRTTKRGCVYE